MVPVVVVIVAVELQTASVTVKVYVPAEVTVIDAVVAPVLQTFPVEALLVKITLLPGHKFRLPEELITADGNGFTVTVATAVAEQLPVVPVTVYVVVVVNVGVVGFDTVAKPPDQV